MRIHTIAALSLAALGTLASAKTDIDLHRYWDQRCHGCHGHAGEFARRTLRVEGDRLAGAHQRSGDALERFLRNHYLSDDLVQPVSAMLLAQLQTPPLYAARCAACHGTAADFVRASVKFEAGELVGASGRKVSEKLATHGKLTREEQPLVLETLRRVRREVAGGGP